jgi:hypothetical protein
MSEKPKLKTITFYLPTDVFEVFENHWGNVNEFLEQYGQDYIDVDDDDPVSYDLPLERTTGNELAEIKARLPAAFVDRFKVAADARGEDAAYVCAFLMNNWVGKMHDMMANSVDTDAAIEEPVEAPAEPAQADPAPEASSPPPSTPWTLLRGSLLLPRTWRRRRVEAGSANRCTRTSSRSASMPSASNRLTSAVARLERAHHPPLSPL